MASSGVCLPSPQTYGIIKLFFGGFSGTKFHSSYIRQFFLAVNSLIHMGKGKRLSSGRFSFPVVYATDAKLVLYLTYLDSYRSLPPGDMDVCRL
jgi:hypothetical protein